MDDKGMRGASHQIMRCEVCGGSAIEDVVDLGLHPLCDDLVPVGSERRSVLYPIVIAYCENCRTAHQKYQVPKRTLFPDDYHYRGRLTGDVLNGMRQLVSSCRDRVGDLAGLSVLDIGCNDGSLLSFFAEQGARTFGIEPTGAAEDAKAAGHKVYRDFISPELAERFVAENGQPDLITFTNVFAHIEDLPAVIAAVRLLMSPSSLLVIENHYLGAVLDRYQFDTFYHEHPRTYSATSFVHIAETLGGHIVAVEFPQRYGGNIRVMIRLGGMGTSDSTPDIAALVEAEAGFGERLGAMGRQIPRWQEAKRDELAKAVTRYGALRAKAFPGRAAILIKLLGLDASVIAEVYEKPGSMKLGHYVPGTRIPIVSDNSFAMNGTSEAPLLNLAWHISGEIRNYMAQQGYKGEIVDIFSPSEFERIA